MLRHEERRGLEGKRWEERVPGKPGHRGRAKGPDGDVGVGGGGDEQ